MPPMLGKESDVACCHNFLSDRERSDFYFPEKLSGKHTPGSFAGKNRGAFGYLTLDQGGANEI